MPNDSYEHYLYETACAKDAQKLLEKDVKYIRSQAAIKNQELRNKLCDIEQSSTTFDRMRNNTRSIWEVYQSFGRLKKLKFILAKGSNSPLKTLLLHYVNEELSLFDEALLLLVKEYEIADLEIKNLRSSIYIDGAHFCIRHQPILPNTTQKTGRRR